MHACGRSTCTEKAWRARNAPPLSASSKSAKPWKVGWAVLRACRCTAPCSAAGPPVPPAISRPVHGPRCAAQEPARRGGAAAEGKPIPTELRNEEAELRKEIELEDDNTAVPRTHIDDEYAQAGGAGAHWAPARPVAPAAGTALGRHCMPPHLADAPTVGGERDGVIRRGSSAHALCPGCPRHPARCLPRHARRTPCRAAAAQTPSPRPCPVLSPLPAGERDPKVLVTTSREPSSRLAQFAKVGPRLAQAPPPPLLPVPPMPD